MTEAMEVDSVTASVVALTAIVVALVTGQPSWDIVKKGSCVWFSSWPMANHTLSMIEMKKPDDAPWK